VVFPEKSGLNHEIHEIHEKSKTYRPSAIHQRGDGHDCSNFFFFRILRISQIHLFFPGLLVLGVFAGLGDAEEVGVVGADGVEGFFEGAVVAVFDFAGEPGGFAGV
jgi:hypothetical protein